MRIIAGSAKGRRLKTPIGSILRPTSDKVREAIFDIIGPGIKDSRFLDLFAGSGAMGIEALSRSAHNATFVDNRQSSVDLIRANLERCKFDKNFEIVHCDALQAISTLINRQRKFEFIFLDPPYNSELAMRSLEMLSAGDLLTPETIILLEHPVKKPFPERIYGLKNYKARQFGDININLYCYLQA